MALIKSRLVKIKGTREILGSAIAVNMQIMTGNFGLIGTVSDTKHGENVF